MISKILLYIEENTNPHHNLAVEKYLFDNVENNEVILYLWQNKNTVVIGKNQNPLKECRCHILENEGGFLARRLSGGGAVYHDLGNLNFTFICHKDNYNLEKQLEVIKTACDFAGIKTEISGRNDILADGRKFSGNAFYNSGDRSYHHGTILIDTNTEKMQRYLTPSKAKLEAKGVSSVKSRVVNLKELSKDLDCEKMKDYMAKAFLKVYNVEGETLSPLKEELISDYMREFSSFEFLYGKTPPYTISFGDKFSWGNIELNLDVQKGVICSVSVFTDAMDNELSQKIEKALIGVSFSKKELEKALSTQENFEDLISLIKDII